MPCNLSTTGAALPSARAVSIVVFGSADRPMSKVTLALTQFGQIINHGFESTTQFTFCKMHNYTIANGTGISCCSSTGENLNATQLHPACLPIAVPTNDRFFNVNTTTITTCMNFVRSIAGPRLNCSIG